MLDRRDKFLFYLSYLLIYDVIYKLLVRRTFFFIGLKLDTHSNHLVLKDSVLLNSLLDLFVLISDFIYIETEVQQELFFKLIIEDYITLMMELLNPHLLMRLLLVLYLFLKYGYFNVDFMVLLNLLKMPLLDFIQFLHLYFIFLNPTLQLTGSPLLFHQSLLQIDYLPSMISDISIT